MKKIFKPLLAREVREKIFHEKNPSQLAGD